LPRSGGRDSRSARAAANAPIAYVLDSRAVLACLGGEPGKARVQQVLDRASHGRCRLSMSIINLGEVAYIVERERGLPRVHEALALLDQLPIDVLPAPRETVLAASHIKASHPVSYADAFAVAIAQSLQASVLTTDPEFRSVEHLIQVERI